MTARMMPPSRLHRHDAQQPMTKLIHQRRKLCTPPCACCSVDRLLDHVVVARPLDHDVVDRAAHGRAGVSSASVVFDRRTGCLAGRQRGPVAGGCSAGFHKANKDRRPAIHITFLRTKSLGEYFVARSIARYQNSRGADSAENLRIYVLFKYRFSIELS